MSRKNDRPQPDPARSSRPSIRNKPVQATGKFAWEESQPPLTRPRCRANLTATGVRWGANFLPFEKTSAIVGILKYEKFSGVDVKPEEKARPKIDQMLQAAGWEVQDNQEGII